MTVATLAAGPDAGPSRPRVSKATPGDRRDWEAFLASQATGDPLQGWTWGEVAAIGGERPRRLIARDDAGRVRGLAQLLVRDAAFGRRVLYAPHGPVWDATAPDRDAALDALLAAIAATGHDERGIVVKLDPRASANLTASELRAALETRGLRRARADLQARTTRILDLRSGPEALFARLEKDTRNLVRRAGKEGVETRVVAEPAPRDLAAFERLLGETGERAGFRVRSSEAFARLAAGFAPGGALRLVLAELDGTAIATCLALGVGERAFYLYAATSRDPAYRHAYGAYAALWALCEGLCAAGYASLDLWGVVEPGDASADPTWAGFSLFKRGFGGAALEHPGTFDLVVSAPWFHVRDLRERLRR